MNKMVLFVLVAFIANFCLAQSFEGELNYRNFENHSKRVRQFSKGMAYNGARNVKVIIKGNNTHIIDETLHLHTILLPEQDEAIIFSDLSKTGLKHSYSSYSKTYLGMYGPEKTIPNTVKTYAVTCTGDRKDIAGKECVHYEGTVTTEFTNTGMQKINPSVVQVDAWIASNQKMPKTYKDFLWGLDFSDVAMKYTVNQQQTVPLFGKMSSYVAAELKSIIPRNVDDSEMEVPSDINVKASKSPFKMLAMYGAAKKALKKAKLYPGEMDEDTDVTYKIEEEWDF